MKKCLGCDYENGCNAALKAACDEGGESANFNYERPMPDENCDHCGEPMSEHDDGECPMPKDVPDIERS